MVKRSSEISCRYVATRPSNDHCWVRYRSTQETHTLGVEQPRTGITKSISLRGGIPHAWLPLTTLDIASVLLSYRTTWMCTPLSKWSLTLVSRGDKLPYRFITLLIPRTTLRFTLFFNGLFGYDLARIATVIFVPGRGSLGRVAGHGNLRDTTPEW